MHRCLNTVQYFYPFGHLHEDTFIYPLRFDIDDCFIGESHFCNIIAECFNKGTYSRSYGRDSAQTMRDGQMPFHILFRHRWFREFSLCISDCLYLENYYLSCSYQDEITMAHDALCPFTSLSTSVLPKEESRVI